MQAATGDSGARGQRESMTFEPVVELNSNVLCQRLISGKGLGQIRTPQGDIELIKQRLKDAQADYAERTKQEGKK